MAQASIIGDTEDNELKTILIRNATTGCVWFVFYNLNFINFYKVSLYCQAWELLCHCCSDKAF